MSNVKGVGAQGRRSLATKLVAQVGNGAGFLPCAPYDERDEIKREQGGLGICLFLLAPFSTHYRI